jgi:hypothetical protein
VDVLVKTFVQEAADRLRFLLTEFGFEGPAVVRDEAGVYPVLRRVRFERADFAVEVSLVLSYGGEEYVSAALLTAERSGSRCRIEIGQRTAHTGYQMRRALELLAEAIRRKLADEEMAPTPR